MRKKWNQNSIQNNNDSLLPIASAIEQEIYKQNIEIISNIFFISLFILFFVVFQQETNFFELEGYSSYSFLMVVRRFSLKQGRFLSERNKTEPNY